MSSHVAKPANPAPLFAIALMACAGTSLERCVPNRSVNEIKKYLMPLSFAIFSRSFDMSFSYPRFLLLASGSRRFVSLRYRKSIALAHSEQASDFVIGDIDAQV